MKNIHIIMAALYGFGWCIIFKVGERQDFLLWWPIIMWGFDIYMLLREMKQKEEKEGGEDKVRRGLLIILCSNILLPLAALTKNNQFLVYSALFVVVGGFVGLVIIVNELEQRKNNKSLKELPPLLVKTLPSDEKCKKDAEYAKCQKDNNPKNEVVEQISCYSMMKNMFEVSSREIPKQDDLKEFCENSIFIIYTFATMQPVCFKDQLCAYDTQEQAIKALDKYLVNPTFREYFYPKEIKAENLVEEVKKCYASGFKSMVVNNKYLVPFSGLPVFDENVSVGISCPAICNYILCYKERDLALECDADATNQQNLQEDVEKQKVLFERIVRELKYSVFLFPEDENRKQIENRELFMVFTDRFALNAYFSKTSMMAKKITFDELYHLTEYDETISGIVVNPGREEFRMKKN